MTIELGIGMGRVGKHRLKRHNSMLPVSYAISNQCRVTGMSWESASNGLRFASQNSSGANFVAGHAGHSTYVAKQTHKTNHDTRCLLVIPIICSKHVVCKALDVLCMGARPFLYRMSIDLIRKSLTCAACSTMEDACFLSAGRPQPS
jgi:hypothetical protein